MAEPATSAWKPRVGAVEECFHFSRVVRSAGRAWGGSGPGPPRAHRTAAPLHAPAPRLPALVPSRFVSQLYLNCCGSAGGSESIASRRFLDALLDDALVGRRYPAPASAHVPRSAGSALSHLCAAPARFHWELSDAGGILRFYSRGGAAEVTAEDAPEVCEDDTVFGIVVTGRSADAAEADGRERAGLALIGRGSPEIRSEPPLAEGSAFRLHIAHSGAPRGHAGPPPAEGRATYEARLAEVDSVAQLVLGRPWHAQRSDAGRDPRFFSRFRLDPPSLAAARPGGRDPAAGVTWVARFSIPSNVRPSD